MTSPAESPQDALKTLVGQAALQFVEAGALIGVGTGSTVNRFIDALAPMARSIAGAVSSSEASSARLRAIGVQVHDANAVGELAVYIDGADEIDTRGYLIKGGGGALTREKIVAAQSRRFVCIADESKCVEKLGRFPLPVEIISMAAARIAQCFSALGGTATLRRVGGQLLVTDNGLQLLDVRGLTIDDPAAFEAMVNQWPGVVTVGVFAAQKANVCLLATSQGVKTLRYDG